MSNVDTVVSVVLADDTRIGARAYSDGTQIWVQAGTVSLYLSDGLAGQLVAAVEQARREAAVQRGER